MDILYNAKASVELFHLLFLEQLGQKLDKRLYAIKGGCNLRFFLGSVRYSEDIDIDVHTVAVTTLKNTVSKILSSVSFGQVLKARNMSIVEISTPKQTATTQRWKVQLQLARSSLPVHTKIEFSRRDFHQGVVTGAILRELITLYKLRPIFASHYAPLQAFFQKIQALIHRSETQARDIFDLYHLIQTQDINTAELQFTEDDKKMAITNAMSMNFSSFKSQVVAYLEQQYQEQYADPAIWDMIVVTVCDYLEQCRS